MTHAPDIGARHDRYLRVVTWARKRYTVGGMLVAYVGHSPTRYERIERAAARKYLWMGATS